MLSVVWRGGCPGGFADEEAIETKSTTLNHLGSPSPGVFADEEAIETSRICTERPGCYRPGVFADEEAIETVPPANPYTIDQKVREYSLTKKRLRQYPPAT